MVKVVHPSIADGKTERTIPCHINAVGVRGRLSQFADRHLSYSQLLNLFVAHWQYSPRSFYETHMYSLHFSNNCLPIKVVTRTQSLFVSFRFCRSSHASKPLHPPIQEDCALSGGFPSLCPSSAFSTMKGQFSTANKTLPGSQAPSAWSVYDIKGRVGINTRASDCLSLKRSVLRAMLGRSIHIFT